MISDLKSLKVGFLVSHPIQYLSPLLRELDQLVDLQVYYAHQPDGHQQAAAGFEVEFEWDTDLLGGYEYTFLKNQARNPDSRAGNFFGCDTPEITQQITSSDYDVFIVNGWYLKSFWQAVWACRQEGIPVLARGDSQLQATGSWTKRLIKEGVYRVLLRAFNGFLSTGTCFDRYLEHYGISSNQIYRAPHCIDNQWFSDRACNSRREGTTNHLRETLGIADAQILLFVGKFISKKRPHDLIDALKFIAHQNGYVAAVFVGSGPLEDMLKKRAKAVDFPIHFAGFKNQSELPAYYAIADALVLPSESETWGLVVNEAMACGTPAIVSEGVGCRPDLIQDGITGFAYSTGNVQQLAAATQQLISKKEGGHDFSQAVREHIQNYSVETAAQKIVEAAEAVSHA